MHDLEVFGDMTVQSDAVFYTRGGRLVVHGTLTIEAARLPWWRRAWRWLFGRSEAGCIASYPRDDE